MCIKSKVKIWTWQRIEQAILSHLPVLQVEHVCREHADPQAGREVAVEIAADHILVLRTNIEIVRARTQTNKQITRTNNARKCAWRTP